MAIHYIMLAVEADECAPVDEMIEEFLIKNGMRILDDDEVERLAEEDD